MTSTPSSNGYSRAGFYIGAVGALFTITASLLGMVFWVGGIAADMQANRGSGVARDDRIAKLENGLHANDLLTASIIRDLREVETQFCASDHIRNLTQANNLRVESLLWEKVFGKPYPTNNAYYPTICNQPGR